MSPEFNLPLFVAKVAAAVLLLALVWGVAGPAYSRFVVAGANTVFSARALNVEVWADEQGAIHARGGAAGRRATAPLTLPGSWEGVILLLALFLATPRLTWRKRLRRLVVAVAILSSFYVLHVTLTFQSVFLSGGSFSVWFLSFGRIWMPVLLWGTLTFGAWFPNDSKRLSNASPVKQVGG